MRENLDYLLNAPKPISAETTAPVTSVPGLPNLPEEWASTTATEALTTAPEHVTTVSAKAAMPDDTSISTPRTSITIPD